MLRQGVSETFGWLRVGALAMGVACLMMFVAVACPEPASAASAGARIEALIRDAIARRGVRAVIIQVTVKGRPVITKACGPSMTGVLVTTRMRFRNGAVAISYVSTLLLRLVDEGKPRSCINCAAPRAGRGAETSA